MQGRWCRAPVMLSSCNACLSTAAQQRESRHKRKVKRMRSPKSTALVEAPPPAGNGHSVSKEHKLRLSLLYRISDFSYKTLINSHTNCEGNSKRLPMKSIPSTVNGAALKSEISISFLFIPHKKGHFNFAQYHVPGLMSAESTATSVYEAKLTNDPSNSNHMNNYNIGIFFP